MFGSREKCEVCGKTVYVNEKLQADGLVFHKACFRCKQCNGVLKVPPPPTLSLSLLCF
jgi:cysteine and glycine-rich protein